MLVADAVLSVAVVNSSLSVSWFFVVLSFFRHDHSN